MKVNHVLGGLIGVAIGDALGVPVEFKSRNYLKENPIKEMTGYGSHNQPVGTWSDDSSLTFCLAESLCNGYNLRDIGNRFVNWYRYDYWTAHGYVFDVGGTTSDSIIKLENQKIAPERCGGREEGDNGNGSLMRILPLAFSVMGLSDEEKYKRIKEVSSLTHAHMRSVISCCIYIEIAINIIKGMNKEESVKNMKPKIEQNFGREEEYHYFHKILKKDISLEKEEFIRTSGYVIDTLEASIWCFLNGNSFEETVLKAVNLGGDTDTIGAVTGGLAGIYYGVENIPQKWRDVLAKKEEIVELSERLYEKVKSNCQ